jgi:hypothetical protein
VGSEKMQVIATLYIGSLEVRLEDELAEAIMEKLPENSAGIIAHDGKGVPMVCISALISLEGVKIVKPLEKVPKGETLQ